MLKHRIWTAAARASGLFAGAVIALMLLTAAPAEALPSFARQTGQECAACHNGFPELTPYGRLFKLNAYTFGDGKSDIPPVAVMSLGSFTHTQAPQTGGAAPHFGPNDNVAVDQTSLFYGGAIAPHLGAFAQMTYSGIGQKLSWDNTDIRYARTADLFGAETVLGLSLNNNPSVQDVWNTTPAWRFPYVSSGLAPSPGASTMIEGAFAQQVLGLSTYAYWNRLVYFELGAYRSLSTKLQSALGSNSAGNNDIDGLAPYWRLALQRDSGRGSFEAGLFGMVASVRPGRMANVGTDRLVDFGVDAQYQFLADLHSVSLQASAIVENQNLDASANPNLAAAANGHNTLRSYRAKATYYYDQTYGATLGAFRIEGSPDAILYANSPNNTPNTTGVIGELDYIPFNHGGPAFWPWLNVKLGLQYVYYPEFGGATGSAATDNNTLYAFLWLAF